MCIAGATVSTRVPSVCADVQQLLGAVLDPGSERKLRAALGCALLGPQCHGTLQALLGDEQALLAAQQRFFGYARRLREHGVQAALRCLLCS